MSDSLGVTRGDFPEDFLFGVATSSYQIEGHAFGGAGATHWDTFAATPGNVVRAENGDIACDHYHRWPEDLDLVRDLGVDAYRFSTSWSRILPEGRGQPNADGLDFYDKLVDGMLERGIKPLATLYHWELPAPLADLGGWRNRDIADWFADFTDIVMVRLGDRIHSVAPINEPWCVAWLSHFLGHHAPGLRDIRAAARAMHHVLLAHGRSVEVMREHGHQNVGVVVNHEYANPADQTDAAHQAAERYDAIYNRWFLGAIFHREYPDAALKGLEPHLPAGWEADMDRIARPLDWVGLNYYTRKNIAPTDEPFWAAAEVEGPLDKTAVGWEIYPEGLLHFLRQAHSEYAKGLPIYVTENGMAWHDDVVKGAVEDQQRIDYYRRHLAMVRQAIAEGIPVKGYVAWSLMDNYEWALGYKERFGLVHVDFETLKRTPKASYQAFQHTLRSE